ncbi:histamine H2 receptor-like [Oculina patagonica]
MAANSSIDNPCFHLPDPSFREAQHRYVGNLITGVINAFFAPFSVVANFLVFFAILLNPSLRSAPSSLLIACLALSDFLVSVIVQPTYVAYRLNENHFGYVNCALRLVYAKGFYICYGVSFMTLSAISFERYLALRLHLRYEGLVTVDRILIVAIFIWLLNMALTFLQWASIMVNTIARGASLFFWFVSLFIAGFSQLRIHMIVRRHSRQIQQQQFVTSSSQNYRMQIKLAVSVAYIVGIYFLFNLPVLVVTTYHQIVKGDITSYDYYSWSETVAFLNSFVNPLVCCWRRQDIRKALKKMLRHGLCKRIIPAENSEPTA